MCGDASFNVGLWQGRVFSYNLLRESPLDPEQAKASWNLPENSQEKSKTLGVLGGYMEC
jgi:hypothetical protein